MSKESLALVVSVVGCFSCANNQMATPTPPPLPPAAQLVPSRLDGETLQISNVPFQFQFRSPRLADFAVSAVGVWQGKDQVTGAEVLESNSNSMTVQLGAVLSPGAYELRFSVDTSVDRRRLETYFLPVEGAIWKLRFFAGAKFCLVRVGLCRETDRDAMSLSLLFSDTSANIAQQDARAGLVLQYDGVVAECEPVTAIGRLQSKEFSYRCSLPSKPSGTAELSFSGQIVGGADSEALVDCSSGTTLGSLTLPYQKDGCGTYRW
jgi:hypothetical protein